jgi:HmuY protein
MGLAIVGAAACDGGESTSGGGKGGDGGAPAGGAPAGGAPAGGTGGGGITPACTEPTAVACEDNILLDMNLQADITPGLITTEPNAAGGFVSKIDATAGGAFTSDPDSYTYGKFTAEGLVKVDISDEASLTSMDWDIAFRRYVVRINSGDSGPSCVQAARVPNTTYDEVTALPDTVTFREDDYFTDDCTFIPDGSGLENSPATALSAYWTYPGCVKMSDYVFVLALADGHHLKLIVDSYYEPTVQEQCDTTDSIPMSNTGAANFVVRWAFLD